MSARACEAVGVDPEVASLWFDGISLDFSEAPPVVVLSDYPSVAEDRQRAASELDRLAGLGETHWYGAGSYSPDVRVRPPHLVAKGDKARVAQGWSRAGFPLNSMLSNPPVQYGAMGDFLRVLTPGAWGEWTCGTVSSIGWWLRRAAASLGFDARLRADWVCTSFCPSAWARPRDGMTVE